jgi:excisionase family DNA binding protein
MALGRLLTISEAAERLRVSRATIYRLVEDGELRPIRPRRHARIAEADLEALIERRSETSA